ncbi:MAG: hypothetical protein JSW12_02710 [Deltaproteobacteria bacterium]|nr:MAG: hypothetical protein JSW12_02710 [Deltaproteobacteria bacterium]
MRIWYQSSAPLGKDPSWKPYEESLKAHLQSLARSGTVVDIHGLEVSSPAQERSHYIEYLNTRQWIEHSLQAQQQGYDVMAGGCMLDLGFFEIREVVDIPVIFAAEISFHLACLLSHKFALLAYNEPLMLRMEERIRHYGLRERFIAGDCFSIAMEELQQGFNKPDPIVQAVNKAARNTIKKGAGILVCSCNILNMVLVDAGVREVDGTPILDGVGAVLKAAEFFGDLDKAGIVKSKKGLYAGLSKKELAQIRKLYGIE